MSGTVADLAGRGRFAIEAATGRPLQPSLRRRTLCAAARAMAPVDGWPVALFALLPAFFSPGPLAAERMGSLLLVSVALFLILTGAGLLAATPRTAPERSTAGRIMGAPVLLSGLFAAAFVAPGIAVLAAAVALCQTTRHTVPPLPTAVRPLLTAGAAALAFDAGTLVLGSARAPEVLAWIGAVAAFGELLVAKDDLLLERGAPLMRRHHRAIRRDLALGLVGLAALTLYLMRLPPADVTTLWGTLAAYAAFLFFLVALWRGLRPGAGAAADPVIIAAVAGWALSSGFAHGSGWAGGSLGAG